MWFPVYISTNQDTLAADLGRSTDHATFVKYFDTYKAFLTAGQGWAKSLLKSVLWLPRNTTGYAFPEYTWPHWNELTAIFELWQLRGHRLEIEFLHPTNQVGMPKILSDCHFDSLAFPHIDLTTVPHSELMCMQHLQDMYIWSDRGRTAIQTYNGRADDLIAVERRKHKYIKKPRRYFRFRTKFPRRVRRRWVDRNLAGTAVSDMDAHQFLTESPFKVQTQDAYYDQPLYQPRPMYVKWGVCETSTAVRLDSNGLANPPATTFLGEQTRLREIDLYSNLDNFWSYNAEKLAPVAISPPPVNARVRLTAYFRCKKFY